MGKVAICRQREDVGRFAGASFSLWEMPGRRHRGGLHRVRGDPAAQSAAHRQSAARHGEHRLALFDSPDHDAASMFGWMLAYLRGPAVVSEWISAAAGGDPFLIMLLLVLLRPFRVASSLRCAVERDLD